MINWKIVLKTSGITYHAQIDVHPRSIHAIAYFGLLIISQHYSDSSDNANPSL
jgi:hypothetical protein